MRDANTGPELSHLIASAVISIARRFRLSPANPIRRSGEFLMASILLVLTVPLNGKQQICKESRHPRYTECGARDADSAVTGERR
jgi:hypothetical protein